ncbi:MAG TPA: hypothetical protein DIW47_00210 [Bacteroidetes bacterium]|nr:hypothetical protein [Bacteroidota bacterium]
MRIDFYPMMKFVIAGVVLLGGTSSRAQTYLINENFDAFPTTNPALPNQGWTNNVIAGDSSVDQWLFSNAGGRTFSAPITGRFATFDSDYFSIGSGAENVALESSSFSTVGYSAIRVQFDQYFDGIYNSTDSIIVEVYDGSAWTGVYSYNGGTSITNSQDLDVTSLLSNKASARIRFRFVGDWSFYWQVDNVRVLGLYDYDATTLNAAFASGICGSSMDSVIVDVANAGLLSISNFTVNANLTGTLGGNAVNSTVSGTFTGTLTPGAKGTIILPPFNTAAGGSVVVRAYTELGTEQNLANDTFATSTINFLGTPPMPTAANADRCGAGSVTLQASGVASSDSIVWYDSPSSNIPIGSGTPFNTPVAGPGNYTYYVSGGRGALKSSLTSTYAAGNGQSGIMFNVTALRSIILDSFEVSMDAGTHLVEVYYKQGTYQGFETNAGAWTLLGFTTVVSTQSNGGPGIYVNVGNKLSLPASSTYAFYIQLPNSTVINYTTASSLQTFSNAEVQLTAGAGKGMNFGATFSPRLFNGALHYSYFPLCESSRQAVQVEVKPLPTGAGVVAGSPFQGTFRSGTNSLPHVVADGDTISLEITPPTGMSNSTFGTDWYISAIDFQTINGSLVPSTDTATFSPGSSSNGSLRFIPSIATSDSLYRITATISSLVTGCDSIVEVYVYVAPRPQPSFTFISTCDGSEVPFTNTSTILSGTLSYEWNFGNGNFSSLENPGFKFPTTGNYDVILKVTSDYGYVAYDTQTVFVKPVPQTSFDAINACEGTAVQLANTTLMPAGTPSFTWDFGDGNTDNAQNTSHQYNVAGNYQVSYTVDVNGCSKTVSKTVTQAPRAAVNFSSSSSSTCNNNNVVFTNSSTLAFGTMGFHWDFGDSATSTASNPTHTYAGFGTFDVQLKAYTDLGCVDSFTAQVTIIQAPKISIAYSAPCVGQQIDFVNNTIVPAGFSNTYDWSFGDGNTSVAVDPSHTYPGVGSYTLKLRSYSSNGCTDSFETTILVNEKPNAGIVVPAVVCDGTEVDFMNSTTSSNISAVTYFWDFNNGVTSTAKDTAFTYSAVQTYTVTMIATIAGGCSDTATQNVRISPIPTADFTYSSTQTQDGTFQFLASATGAGISYQWFFGDGAKSTTSDPIHQYQFDGLYIARLVTKNADNCVNEKTDTLRVFRTAIPNVAFGAALSLYPNPNKGQFVLKFEGADFNDVTLTVVNALGQVIAFEATTNATDEMELDLQNAVEGIYYLRVINSEGAQSTLQFVVR